MIFPINPNAAVRANWFYLNLGGTPIQTAAGRGHVDLWTQGINIGLEFHW